MSVSNRNHRVLAVLAGTAIALAGCAGSGDTASRPSSASPDLAMSDRASPSVSASASPAAPLEIPVAAQQATDEGGSAFATHAVQEFVRARNTNDARPFLALTLPTCDNCSRVSDGVTRQVSEGKRADGATFTVAQTMVQDRDMDKLTVDVVGTMSAYSVISTADGAVIGSRAASDLSVRLDLQFTQEGWRISSIKELT